MNMDPSRANDAEYVRIAVLESTFEAQVLTDVLDNETIPHLIQSYRDTAYDGLFQVQKGWGEVRALEHDKEKILELLEEIRSGDATLVFEYPERAETHSDGTEPEG